MHRAGDGAGGDRLGQPQADRHRRRRPHDAVEPRRRDRRRSRGRPAAVLHRRYRRYREHRGNRPARPPGRNRRAREDLVPCRWRIRGARGAVAGAATAAGRHRGVAVGGVRLSQVGACALRRRVPARARPARAQAGVRRRGRLPAASRAGTRRRRNLAVRSRARPVARFPRAEDLDDDRDPRRRSDRRRHRRELRGGATSRCQGGGAPAARAQGAGRAQHRVLRGEGRSRRIDQPRDRHGSARVRASQRRRGRQSAGRR